MEFKADGQSQRVGRKTGKYQWPDTGLGGIGKRFLKCVSQLWVATRVAATCHIRSSSS